VLEEFRQLAGRRPSREVLPSRENEVLRLVAKGYGYQEIGRRLSISARTVRHYMQNILTRLQLRHEDALLDREDEETLSEQPDPGDGQRILATVLFTDIVGSTEHAARVGDHRWRDLLESHHAIVRRELARFRGREIDTAGDGFLATFEGPADAVRCAGAIVESVRRLGLEVRAGLHTGEVERVGEAVRGIAIHIGARVVGAARPGEVVVSGTVRDLVTGSGLAFTDLGARTLKGVPGEWRLYSLDQEALRG
jgi:class 3 adenylate cyclase